MLRIAQRDLKAARSILGHHYPRTHDLALLCALIRDLGGDPTPFQPLVRFSPFGTRIRYDEVAPLGLERSL
jgi:hypothetical protein